jgi:two-component system response regulator AtoC
MSRSEESVLIVDDEESIRTVLQEKLEDLYHCRTAENGDQALEMLAREPASLVLCDVKMPGRDGIQVLGEIIKTRPDTAVLMITALYDVDVAVRALKLGAYDFITKPFHLEEVVIAAERALEKRRLRMENRRYQTELEDRVREQTRRIQDLLTQEARARVLDCLYRTASMVDAHDDAERALSSMLKSLMETVGANRGAVLARTAAGDLTFRATTGVGEGDRESLRQFISDLGRRGGEALCATGDSFPDDLRSNPFVRRSQLCSLAHVQLNSRGESLGSLYVDSRDNAFDLSLVGPEFLSVFARLASSVVHAAREHDNLERNVAALKNEVAQVYRHDDIIGDSPAMQEVFRLVDRVKNADTTVLVLGESGTGKEKIARLVHHLGPRKDKPFIAVNCAALPSDLLESELFGIESGTATGVTARAGKFEAANGGTIFLDEIGDLSPLAQAKLLRVIQEKQLERLGSNAPIDLDIRVIAATNVDLRQAVQARKFREDLFYRLNILPIFLPPLRERKEDIPALVKFYVGVFCREQKKELLQITEEALDSFVRPSWPGNIRELKNALERSVLLSDGKAMTPHFELRGPRSQSRPDRLDLEPAIEMGMTESDLVASYAKHAFDRFRRYDRTSEFLGISFKTLKKRLSDADEMVTLGPGRPAAASQHAER